MKKIAIVCSGGDCQGMNVGVKVFTQICKNIRITPIAVIGGYRGLIDCNFSELTEEFVANIDNLGGSIIKSGRCADFKEDKFVKIGVENLKKANIDGLIVLGGNGSFRGLKSLNDFGAKVIGIPASIDNDLFFTAKSIGFETAVNQATKVVDDVKQSMKSSDRGLVVKVMGRDCGDIALQTAVSTLANCVVMRELGSTENSILKDVRSAIENKVDCPVVVVSENIGFNVEKLSEFLEKNTGKEFRFADVGYLARGGAPGNADRVLATRFTCFALNLILQGKSGLAVGIKNNEIFAEEIEEVLSAKERNINIELIDIIKVLNNLSKR